MTAESLKRTQSQREQLSEQEVEKRSAWVDAALNDVLNERRHQEEIAALKSRHAEEREALVKKCAEVVLAERVDYDATHDSEDLAYNTALDHAATAILALLSEPKELASKEWCMNMAKLEGDQEIGAGYESIQSDSAQGGEDSGSNEKRQDAPTCQQRGGCFGGDCCLK